MIAERERLLKQRTLSIAEPYSGYSSSFTLKRWALAIGTGNGERLTIAEHIYQDSRTQNDKAQAYRGLLFTSCYGGEKA